MRTSFGAENNHVLTRLLYRSPLSKLVLNSPERGGANLAFFLTGEPGVDWQSGRFYAQTKLATRRQTNAQANDEALVAEFWQRTDTLLGLNGQRP